MPTFALLKLVHLLAVVVWIGGACGLAVLSLRVARSSDRHAAAAVLRHAGFYGRTVIGPASVLTLISGIGMVVVIGLGFGPLWVRWGLAGVFGHFVLGATLLRRATARLIELAEAPETPVPVFAAARRRLGLLNVVYVALLLSTVSVMVLQPMF